MNQCMCLKRAYIFANRNYKPIQQQFEFAIIYNVFYISNSPG